MTPEQNIRGKTRILKELHRLYRENCRIKAKMNTFWTDAQKEYSKMNDELAIIDSMIQELEGQVDG